MVIYVLMMLYDPGYKQGNALATAEFSSKEACETAGKSAEKRFGGRFYWECAAK